MLVLAVIIPLIATACGSSSPPYTAMLARQITLTGARGLNPQGHAKIVRVACGPTNWKREICAMYYTYTRPSGERVELRLLGINASCAGGSCTVGGSSQFATTVRRVGIERAWKP